MASLANRIKKVHEELGRVLETPKAFGLRECPTKLADALTKMRRTLMEQWIEGEKRGAEDDGLTHSSGGPARQHLTRRCD